MKTNFDISLEWFPYTAGNERDHAFSAFIGISAGNVCLTQVEDLNAKTIRDRIYVCAGQLAGWFAANWWRLRWESFPKSGPLDVSRALSHCMASAGGGFVWPDIVFDSDGDSVGVAVPRKTKPTSYALVDYLSDTDDERIFIPGNVFERTIDGFLDAVICRGDLMNVSDRSLAELWREVLDERHDPEASRYRKWEAIAGYDPDEAPKALLGCILAASARYGQQASEEVVAQARHESVETFNALPGVSRESGVRVTMPPLPKGIARGGSADEQPWQKAERFARSARRMLGFDASAPVSGKQLADLAGASDKAIFGDQVVASPIPFLLRDEGKSEGRLIIPGKYVTSRRFAVTRLIGDQLYARDRELLRPATGAQTVRQKFQRAFATEFLCPFDALQDKLGTETPGDDDIMDAAEHFGVSPLLVRTVLVNKGVLECSQLSQQAG